MAAVDIAIVRRSPRALKPEVTALAVILASFLALWGASLAFRHPSARTPSRTASGGSLVRPANVATMAGADGPPVLRFQPTPPEQAYAINAAIPDSADFDPPAQPLRLAGAQPEDRRVASDCLTQAVYYEAASEPLEGQQAVAQVVLNRVRDPQFPKTVCGVIYQGHTRQTGCQFSFTCDGSLDRVPGLTAWKEARAVAESALNGFVLRRLGHATHYHTVWVVPYWSPSLVKWGRIGAHVFYRWAGAAGDPAYASGHYQGGEVDPHATSVPEFAVVTPPAAAEDGVAPTASLLQVDPVKITTSAELAPPTAKTEALAEVTSTLPAVVLVDEVAGTRNANQSRSGAAIPRGW